MLLEPSASLLPRLALCLSLLAANAGFARDSKAPPPAGTAPVAEAVSPPPAPAAESPAQPAPRGEVFPREQKDEGSGAAGVIGRLILQPPAGILAGGATAFAGFFSTIPIALGACELIIEGATTSTCTDAVLYPAAALSASVGATLGVMAVGYLLDGNARVGATAMGALAGTAVGITMFLSGAATDKTLISVLLVGPALGATLAYALSDAFFPEPRRAVVPAGEDEDDEDEYVRVLPMVSTTRTGGIIGGLVGRF